MGPGIPPLKMKIMLESNPLKSRIFSTEIGRIPARASASSKPKTRRTELDAVRSRARIGGPEIW